jgi:predicted glutamine amidotransferase
MCRLFGAVSHGPVYYDLFEEFADLAVTGNTSSGHPDERGHRDGWGLVMFRNGTLEQQARGAGSAHDDPKYSQAAWRIAKRNIDRKAGERIVVLGHIRRASDGMPVGTEWSHPFVETKGGRTWAFAHNGGIDHLPFRKEEGLIDSQHLFRRLLGNLDGPEPEAVAGAVKATVDEVRGEFGGYTGLNVLLTDGERLHAFREFSDHGEYYTLFYDDMGEAVVVCSQPILTMRENLIAKGALVSVGADLGITRRQVL